jgi:PKD repeat protein
MESMHQLRSSLARLRCAILISLFAASLLIQSGIVSINQVEGSIEMPSLWVKVHRVRGVDPIEIGWLEDGPDFRYRVSVWDGEKYLTALNTLSENTYDVIVDATHQFDLGLLDTTVTAVQIELFEMDGASYDQVADISEHGGYVSPTQTPPAPRGAIYFSNYDLKTNNLLGDDVVVESGYLKTSGDYDGSITTDENDAELWFNVWDNYDAPTAYAGTDRSIYTGDKVNFDASGSSASAGSSIVKYEWDFDGDGVIDMEGEKASHTFTEKGNFNVKLVVTDSLNQQAFDYCLITVRNRIPSASFTYAPTTLTVRDSINFYDTSSDPDGRIVEWLWGFGEQNTSALMNPIHNFKTKGSHTVTLTVTDNDGGKASFSTTIIVENLPPEACFNCTPIKPTTDQIVAFVDQSTDPEDIPLTSWLWNFGDGYTSNLQYPTHKFASKGNYQVTLAVSDDEGEFATYSLSISVIEPPPSEVAVPVPLWFVLLATVTVAGVCVLSVIVWRKRRARHS